MAEKRVVHLFKILGANTRLRIIELLKEGPKNVNEIVRALNVSQPAVSKQLRLLEESRVVDSRKDGYWVYYALVPEALRKIRQELNEVCTCGCDCCGVESELSVLQDYERQLLQELQQIRTRIRQIEI